MVQSILKVPHNKNYLLMKKNLAKMPEWMRNEECTHNSLRCEKTKVLLYINYTHRNCFISSPSYERGYTWVLSVLGTYGTIYYGIHSIVLLPHERTAARWFFQQSTSTLSKNNYYHSVLFTILSTILQTRYLGTFQYPCMPLFVSQPKMENTLKNFLSWHGCASEYSRIIILITLTW